MLEPAAPMSGWCTNFSGARSARVVLVPGELGRAVRGSAGERRDRPALRTPERGAVEAFEGPTIVTTGTASGKSLCFQLPTLEVLTAIAPRGRFTCIRPRRWPRTRRARCTRSACTSGPAGDLRRRHAARGTVGDPQAVQPDPDQSRHAPRRDPAPPSRLGRAVREPGVRRRRRGPRLSRRVRLARRQRASAAAARGRDPRHRAAIPAGQRDDRQSGRAGRAPDRPDGFKLVDQDGAPRASRRVAMWNPPLLDEELGTRGSALYEAAELFSELVIDRAPGRSAS